MGGIFEVATLISDWVLSYPSRSGRALASALRGSARSAAGPQAGLCVTKRAERQHLAASMLPAAELCRFDYHARQADLPLQVVPLVYR